MSHTIVAEYKRARLLNVLYKTERVHAAAAGFVGPRVERRARANFDPSPKRHKRQRAQKHPNNPRVAPKSHSFYRFPERFNGLLTNDERVACILAKSTEMRRYTNVNIYERDFISFTVPAKCS